MRKRSIIAWSALHRRGAALVAGLEQHRAAVGEGQERRHRAGEFLRRGEPSIGRDAVRHRLQIDQRVAAPHAGRERASERRSAPRPTAGTSSAPSVRSAANVPATPPVASIHVAAILPRRRRGPQSPPSSSPRTISSAAFRLGVEPALGLRPHRLGSSPPRPAFRPRAAGRSSRSAPRVPPRCRASSASILLLLGLEERQVVLVGLLLLARRAAR